MALKTGPDTSISTYRSKRDFAVTSEPAPGDTGADTESRMFVVQKHHAHRAGLHWDFRLEYTGVLWSWAVPKGPSLDPTDRQVAIHSSIGVGNRVSFNPLGRRSVGATQVGATA